MKDNNRSLRDRFVDGVRVFNKYIFNRLTLFIARRGIGPFTVVIHEGRTSGRRYETPLLVTYRGDEIVIPLPYGDHVDWLRNVLARGGCEMLWKKRTIHAVAPELIDFETASTILPAKLAGTLRRFDVDHYLRIKRYDDNGG